MRAFSVIITSEAQADIRRLAPVIRERILSKLEWMGENVELLRHEALQGDEWSGCLKYRVGDYRIIYQVDLSAKKLVVLKVGHRREVYG